MVRKRHAGDWLGGIENILMSHTEGILVGLHFETEKPMLTKSQRIRVSVHHLTSLVEKYVIRGSIRQEKCIYMPKFKEV